MPESDATLDASSSQRLPLRLRPDLRVHRDRFLGREQVVLKDPISLRYYRFEEEEYAILEVLDGESSLEQIRSEFERRFQPRKITLRELERFLGRAYRDSLIVSDAPGQGRELQTRHARRVRAARHNALTNVLCIRFKGINPDRFLDWMNRCFGWAFSPAAFAVCLLVALCALLLMVTEFATFRAKLPAFHDFFATGNWIWLAVSLAITKILHEIGHGLACKRFGGQCHEMGVMLLVLTPCLYCNVSDAWTVPGKWRRVAIAAAGMYVELVLASICTFLWWLSEPGLLNYLCLNVMVVCSVSTIVFNANPLLRYDGYYILADLVEIPNLRMKAHRVVQRAFTTWLLGLPPEPDRFLPKRRRALLASYAVASAVYRWLVLLSILWFLYRVFEPYGLKSIGLLLVCAAFYGLLVRPIWQLGAQIRQPGVLEKVKKSRLAICGVVIGLAAFGALLIPLPHYVRCDVTLQLRKAAPVYVDTAGALEHIHVRPGTHVQKGQPLATLENLDVQLAVERLIAERNQLSAKLDSLRQRSLRGDTSAALDIEPSREALAAVEERLERRRLDLEKLRLTAPADGIVFSPLAVGQDSETLGLLPSWSGHPLETRNVGAYLSEGVLVCRVVNPGQLEAVLAIDESQIEFVRPGQEANILLDQLPGSAIRAQIKETSTQDARSAGRSAVAKHGSGLPTRSRASDPNQPIEPAYQASCHIDDPAGQIVVGGTGQARIFAGYQTLAYRFRRYIARTFSLSG